MLGIYNNFLFNSYSSSERWVLSTWYESELYKYYQDSKSGLVHLSDIINTQKIETCFINELFKSFPLLYHWNNFWLLFNIYL